VEVRGATSPEGKPWVQVSAQGSGPSAWIPLGDLADDAAAAKKRLRAAGIHLFKEDQADAIDKARGVSAFPPEPLIEHSGWVDRHFALPSGRVISPPSDQSDSVPVVLFDVDPVKCASSGTLEDWLGGVERLAVGQAIITFVLMVAFAAPILRLSRVRENVGFELAGPKGLGKSTAQQLASSICGGALEPAGRNYWISGNTTANAIEDQFPIHADMPLLIEETSLFHAGESDKVRTTKFKEFIFRASTGAPKARKGASLADPVRFTYLTSANDGFATLLGGHTSEAGAAAADRLLTIPIAATRRHGIFSKLPAGCYDGDDAARAIAKLVSTNFGTAMPHFLNGLVEARHQDETTLRADIEAFMDEFRNKAGVDGNSGTDARVADAFGLAYAAGRLAQQYGALPSKLPVRSAALRCHALNRKAAGRALSQLTRLRMIARRRDTLEIGAREPLKVSESEIFNTPAIIRINKQGVRELLISPGALARLFPSPKALLRDKAVRAIMRCDEGRSTVKVVVHPRGKARRFHVFRLSENDA